MTKINVVNQPGTPASAFSAPPEREIDLAFVFAHVKRNRWMLIGLTLLGLILGMVYYALAERQYLSETTLMIDLDGEAAASQMTEVMDALGGKGQPEVLAPALAIANSTKLMERIVDRMDLVSDPEFNPNLGEPGAMAGVKGLIGPYLASIRETLGMAPADPAPVAAWATPEVLERRYAVDTLERKIEVRDLNDDLRLSIAVSTTKPKKSADILDVAVVELNEMMLSSKAMALGNARDWITSEAETIEVRLREIEDRISSEISAGSILPSSDSDRLGQNAERLVQGELLLETNRRKNLALARLRESLARMEGGESPASALGSIPQELRTELVLDYQPIFSWPARATPPSPAEIASAANRVDADLDRQAVTTQQRERDIQPIRAYTRQLSTAQNRYQQLQTVYVTNTDLLKNLRTRLAELQIELAGEVEKLTVLESAKPPLRHSRPALPFSLVAGSLLGLLLGLAAMIVQSLRRNAFVSLDEVEQTYEAAAIGIVPEFRSSHSKKFAWQKLPHESKEAYRRAYAAFYVLPEHERPRSLMVSSSIPGEGKTTTSVYIAAAASEEGKRALVVDLDFRKRSISRYLKLESERGVYNVFRGEFSIEEAVVPYDRDGIQFDILTSDGRQGSAGDKRRETLSVAGIRAMIDAAKEAGYDVIILDAPPVLAVQDSAMIGQAADHVLCVVSTSDIKKRVAKRAITEWKRAGIDIDGLLIRGQKAELYEYYGYDYYHYSYAAKEEGRPRRGSPNRRRRSSQRPRPEARPEPQRIPEAGE